MIMVFFMTRPAAIDPKCNHSLLQLHVAIINNDTAFIEGLLESGHGNLQQQLGGLRLVDVFLFISVLRMKPEIVCLCLMYGARINAVDINGHTPLYVAAVRCADAGMVRLLLALGANSAVTFGRRRQSLLGECARKGRVEVVRVMVASKAVNLDQRSIEGTTALSITCHHGHVEVARALLFAGAEASLKNYRSATARDVAHLWGWQNCVDLLEVSVLYDTINSPLCTMALKSEPHAYYMPASSATVSFVPPTPDRFPHVALHA